MTIYIAVVNAEGHPESIWTTGVSPNMPEGEYPGDSTKTVVHIEGLLEEPSAFIASNYYKEGVWTARDARPGDYYSWENEAWVLDSSAFFTLVRQHRDSRLYASDWTQVADAPLTDAKKAEWVTYRAILRRVPAENSGAVDITEIAWPTAP
jgi:hypothetical protein|tara:strand:- start:39 stop:491 length:453 start_codon:yes stop_codon:yes gene_type:complete